jgi:dTDP-glucose 4,6-dehydratase
MEDYHTSRPGQDLRYALSGSYMESLGRKPKISLRERIKGMVQWSLENDKWLK